RAICRGLAPSFPANFSCNLPRSSRVRTSCAKTRTQEPTDFRGADSIDSHYTCPWDAQDAHFMPRGRARRRRAAALCQGILGRLELSWVGRLLQQGCGGTAPSIFWCYLSLASSATTGPPPAERFRGS